MTLKTDSDVDILIQTDKRDRKGETEDVEIRGELLGMCMLSFRSALQKVTCIAVYSKRCRLFYRAPSFAVLRALILWFKD